MSDIGDLKPVVTHMVEGAIHWRCFHCDEVFTDRPAARDHFGVSEHDRPACQIDIRHVRWLESEHRKAYDEDTAALRTVRSILGEHERLRRRAEEEGFAKGFAAPMKAWRAIAEEAAVAIIPGKGKCLLLTEEMAVRMGASVGL